MKKLLLILTLGLATFALAGFVGCSDDEETVIGPSAADSAKVEMVFSEFDEMNSVNGEMLFLTLEIIDQVMNPGGGRKIASPEADILLTWHGDSEYWYCTAEDTSDSGDEVFHYVDSVQFLHGSTPVQFPIDSLLTEVRSDMRLTVTGDHIDTASAWHSVALTMEDARSDTLTVSGTGGLLAQVTETEIDDNDTTICDVYFNLGFVYTSLVFDVSSLGDEDELGCPLTGTLASTGSIDIDCTGADAGSVSGSWAVSQVFDHGEMDYTIQFGGFTFRGTETCD